MPPRGYRQTCSVARALDLIGERWTLLIIRDLLAGPRRFSDLLAGLPGIGTNLLSARLKSLAALGIVTRRRLPPPAASTVYDLTDAGRDLEPIILALVRWGLRHARPPRRGALHRPDLSIVAMRALFRPERAQGADLSLEFRVDGDPMHAVVDAGRLATGLGPAHSPNTILAMDAPTFRRLESGVPLEELESSGNIRVEGSRRALRRFSRMFDPPRTEPVEEAR